VRMLYDIGSLREFQRFIQLLAARVSSLLNLSDLAKELGVSLKTLNRWLSILEAGFIVVLLAPYHKNLGKRIVKHPKLYFLDCGLASYLTGTRTKEQLLNSPFSAQLFENYCIQEISKYFSHTCKRKPNMFFFRANYGVELDLLIEHDFNTLTLIEFKFTKTPNKNMAKGILLLKKELKNVKIKDSFIVCLVDKEEVIAEGVKATNIFDLLRSYFTGVK
jgi:predicted AAA+ superfamily ATPase